MLLYLKKKTKEEKAERKKLILHCSFLTSSSSSHFFSVFLSSCCDIFIFVMYPYLKEVSKPHKKQYYVDKKFYNHQTEQLLFRLILLLDFIWFHLDLCHQAVARFCL